MRNRFMAVLLCAAVFLTSSCVWAQMPDYDDVINMYKQDGKTPQQFQTDDGNGNTVNVVAREDTLYVTTKYVQIRSTPGENGEKVKNVLLGAKMQRVGVCDNGWSKVIYGKEEDQCTGYVPNSSLSEKSLLKSVNDTPTVIADSNILDYPSRKDGEIVGEVLEQDQVERTATVNDIWSRIYYLDEEENRKIGYIPTSVLEGEAVQVASSDEGEVLDTEEEEGTIHKSEGEGIFSDAVEQVGEGSSSVVNGVQVGNPVSVSSDAVLVNLGNFRITHYCPCSICCGPWANGITSTGVTATTNHTIAVDPTQIPYGSKVVINGQVYVAEDCGGAIKTNCIDIYVATHEEGESLGVYYTDVYLLQE
ncbi:MAG: 3D domain-containing protein [Blautia sp.]|nr:3D domain-containing protein [Blautia sp.]